jgi:hypothetical protein
MPMALRPRANAVSINSRQGSQALAVGCGTGAGGGESVVTPLAGFEHGGGCRPHWRGARMGTPAAFR